MRVVFFLIRVMFELIPYITTACFRIAQKVGKDLMEEVLEELHWIGSEVKKLRQNK